MVEVRSETSNRNPRDGLAGGVAQSKIVEVDETTSNQIFEILSDWEHILQAENIDFEELGL